MTRYLKAGKSWRLITVVATVVALVAVTLAANVFYLGGGSTAVQASPANLVAAAPQGQAVAPVIDQEQLISNGEHGLNIDAKTQRILVYNQTITAGIDGLLTNVEFEAEILSNNVSFFLLEGATWLSDFVLAQPHIVKLPQGKGVYNVDVSLAGVLLNKGDFFSIGLKSLTFDNAIPNGTFLAAKNCSVTVANAYPRGGLLQRSGGGGFTGLGNDDDMKFRTFMDQTVKVPADDLKVADDLQVVEGLLNVAKPLPTGELPNDPNCPPLNSPPQLTSVSPITIDEGGSTTKSLDAIVSDVETPDSEIAWTGASNDTNVATVTINPTTRVATITGVDGPGSTTVTLTATDGGALQASTIVDVTVNNVAPIVDLGAAARIQLSDTFDRVASFTDPGADSWTFSVGFGDIEGPSLLFPVLDPINKTIRLRHTYTSAGTFTVTLTVFDGNGGSGTSSVLWNW